MKIIVVGCGRLGVDLATRLYQRDHEVAVIDQVPAALHNLPSDFQGRTIEGDALNQDVLRRAGIEALAAVTNSDALNVVVAHIARTVFNVQTVVVRNYSPKLRALFETFGIQYVSSTTWGAQRIEELLYHNDMHTVFSAGNGEVEIYELIINKEMAGRTVEDLIACDNCIPVALTRAGKAVMPGSETVVKAGDVLHISATFEGVENMRKKICLKPLEVKK
jgi:trk system potassium uptake protein TrkA